MQLLKKKSYKIGTRGSLLAVAQCTLLKEKLEDLTGDSFELVTIKTQGDQQTDRPLWQLEGKDFFTKELDQALLQGEVDLVVHSYKDLGSERPGGIKLAAITERNFAHDILLIRPEVVKKLQQNKFEGCLKIGTSSPRRIVNIESSLANFLPGKNPQSIKCLTLRGNVNTRIGKLKSGQYHGIVLALAGLERLAQYRPSQATLEKLLSGLNFSILPASSFPSAASQGALAIECAENRKDKGELESKLKLAHHQATAQSVAQERSIFRSFGGGCHLAVGIHVREKAGLSIHSVKGEYQHKSIGRYQSIDGQKVPQIKKGEVFIGLPLEKLNKPIDGVVYDQLVEKKLISNSNDPSKNIFISSTYCLQAINKERETRSLWTAGTRSWKKAAQMGLWINGTSDGLGHRELEMLKESKAIKTLTKGGHWQVLSAVDAHSNLGEVLPCYQRVLKEKTSKYQKKLAQVKFFYWTSFPQYQLFLEQYPEIIASKNVQHFCGMGKTLDQFRQHGISIIPMLRMTELYPQKA